MASLNEVSKEIVLALNRLETNILREVALDYVTTSKKRIFTDGVKADGKQIGWYKASTIAMKRKKGRFSTRTVNLRDTETLINSYRVEVKSGDYEVGFVEASRMSGIGKDKKSINNTELIVKLKNQYGNDLFDPSQEELDYVDVLINKIKLF